MVFPDKQMVMLSSLVPSLNVCLVALTIVSTIVMLTATENKALL